MQLTLSRKIQENSLLTSLRLSHSLSVFLSLSLIRWRSNLPSLVTGSQKWRAKFLINLALQNGGSGQEFSIFHFPLCPCVCVCVSVRLALKSLCACPWRRCERTSSWLPKRNWANRNGKLTTWGKISGIHLLMGGKWRKWNKELNNGPNGLNGLQLTRWNSVKWKQQRTLRRLNWYKISGRLDWMNMNRSEIFVF